jgi:hypothetical protein
MGQPQDREKFRPDIEAGVSLRARTLRFETVPEIEAGSYSSGEYEVRTECRRKGLPDRLEPGITYRDVQLRGRAAFRSTDEEGKE